MGYRKIPIAILLAYVLTLGFASFHTHSINSDHHDSTCVLCGFLHYQQTETVFYAIFITPCFLFSIFFESIVLVHSKYILPFSNGPPLN